MKSFLITPQNKKVEVSPANGKNFTLTELYKLIECSMIEIISMRDYPELFMVIDEEGKLEGKEVNVIATKFSGLMPYDVIVGNALICHNSLLD